MAGSPGLVGLVTLGHTVFKALLSSSFFLMLGHGVQYHSQAMQEGPFSKTERGCRIPAIGPLGFSPLRPPLS